MVYYGKLCWWVDMGSWLYCCRVGIGTEVHGVLVSFLRTTLKVKTKVVIEQTLAREIQTREALYISS